MHLRKIIDNKHAFLEYNELRKKTFLALSPREAETILYFLPWLLSVNYPSCPGYLEDLKSPFNIDNLHRDAALAKKEGVIRKSFGLRSDSPRLNQGKSPSILGIYTIGSVGTASQTEHSDCDVWICIDKGSYDRQAFDHLSRKLNLIKDWLDGRLRLPVYFFLCDVEDVRRCNFGQMDDESCGTTQRNILKEELYRTMMVVAGRIPLWWVCHDGDKSPPYAEVAAQISADEAERHDFVDLGDIETISTEEYYGAALWQLNKALIYPLKSILKMLLLKMQIDAPQELLCAKFRRAILGGTASPTLRDPSLFTVDSLLNSYPFSAPKEREFVKECIYLRFDIKMFSKKAGLKEELAAELLSRHRLEREAIYRLNEFSSWKFSEQAALGERIFRLLIEIYKQITESRKESCVSAADLTAVGRKIASCLVHKTGKVLVIHKPMNTMTLPSLTFKITGKKWEVCDDSSDTIVSHTNVVACVAHLTWNGIYDATRVRMEYNSTSVTVQEIMNLARVMHDFFGSHDVSSVEFSNFLEHEGVTKILVVVGFENSPYCKDIDDLNAVYLNCWGELFVRPFRSQETFLEFVRNLMAGQRQIPEVRYYLKRNSHYYEKNIARTKQAVIEAIKAGLNAAP